MVVRVTTQVRERSSPTWKGMRIVSAEHSRTCMTRRLPAKLASAATGGLTMRPSNALPHSAERLAKKVGGCAAGVRRRAAGDGEEGEGDGALHWRKPCKACSSARMRTASRMALRSEKSKATSTRPKIKGSDGDFADDDQIIGVIEETIGPAGDQLLAGDDDDARGPARTERSQDPDAAELEQSEQSRGRADGPAGRGRATTGLPSQAAWSATISG